MCAIIPGAFFLVGAVLLAIRAFSGGPNGLLAPGDPAHAFLSLLFALSLFGLGYYIGNNNRCPKCKKWNVLEEKEKIRGADDYPANAMLKGSGGYKYSYRMYCPHCGYQEWREGHESYP